MPVELKKKKKELGLMGYSIWNPYTPYGRFWKSVSPRGCEFSNALDLLCDFYIRFITEGVNVLFKSSTGGVWNSNGIAQFEQDHTDSVRHYWTTV